MKLFKFDNCNSVEQVVELINKSIGRAKLAANYAYDVANAKDNLTIEEIEAQLGLLIDAGARVDFEEAQDEATRTLAIKENLEAMMMNVSGSIFLGSDVNYQKAYGKEKYIARCREALAIAAEYLDELENE